MGVTVCPAAVVAAPVESVWELLYEPTLYDEWWDMHTERIAPEGKVTPGQMLHGKTRGLGRDWDVNIKIEAVNPQKHRVQFLAGLPLGTVNHATITCTPIDTTSCRVQFG
jgi:uncharacterized protein YndB with AHSA1/START domain